MEISEVEIKALEDKSCMFVLGCEREKNISFIRKEDSLSHEGCFNILTSSLCSNLVNNVESCKFILYAVAGAYNYNPSILEEILEYNKVIKTLSNNEDGVQETD